MQVYSGDRTIEMPYAIGLKLDEYQRACKTGSPDQQHAAWADLMSAITQALLGARDGGIAKGRAQAKIELLAAMTRKIDEFLAPLKPPAP